LRAISKNILQSIIIPVLGVIISYILKNGIIELNVFFILVILSIIISIVIFIVGYYSSKQKHYETDIEPIFNKLANININDLDSFQESWNNIKDSFIFKIKFDKLDSRNMARDHFKAYQKLNMIYAEIIDECEIYNSKVIKDIEDIEDIILSIFNQIPNLDKYSKNIK
jgi:trehalose-6-phosphate synthase